MIKYLKTDSYGRLPVRISYSALKKFQESTGKSLMQDGVLRNLFGGELEELLYYSLESGHKADKKELTLAREEMEAILDESMFEFFKLIPEFFGQQDKEKDKSKQASNSGQAQKK